MYIEQNGGHMGADVVMHYSSINSFKLDSFFGKSTLGTLYFRPNVYLRNHKAFDL
jgi:hypothetical protein